MNGVGVFSKVTALSTAVLAAASLLGLPASAADAPPDPYFGDQWNLHRIRVEQAWDVADGSGAIVAVVDSGVDLTHPDLAANVLSYPDADFVEPAGTCQRPPGSGPRTCKQDGAQDKNGHGTHVAGIVAAVTRNGIGVAGVAPGAQILPVRVLNENAEGDGTAIANGIRYAADKGADVINISIGLPSGYDVAGNLFGWWNDINSAIAYASQQGAVIVVAAGNDSAPICAEPAAHTAVLCVGATDPNEQRSYYSNSDPTLRENYLVAPGGQGLWPAYCPNEILSTYLRGAAMRTLGRTCARADGYDAFSGTSAAAPHVAGVAALLVSLGVPTDEIAGCVLSTAHDLGAPGRDPMYGYGRVDAFAAVTRCQPRL